MPLFDSSVGGASDVTLIKVNHKMCNTYIQALQACIVFIHTYIYVGRAGLYAEIGTRGG